MIVLEKNEGCKIPELKIPPSVEEFLQETLSAKQQVDTAIQAVSLAVGDALKDVASQALNVLLDTIQAAQDSLALDQVAREISKAQALIQDQGRIYQELLDIPCPLPMTPRDASLDQELSSFAPSVDVTGAMNVTEISAEDLAEGFWEEDELEPFA